MTRWGGFAPPGSLSEEPCVYLQEMLEKLSSDGGGYPEARGSEQFGSSSFTL